MFKKLQIAVFFFFLSTSFLHAQLQNANWPFSCGGSYGLTFSTTPASTIGLTPNIIANTPCSSVSDAAGNLLFYAYNNQLFNKLNMPMPGTSSLTTYYIEPYIVPKPGNPNQYYVFHTGPNWYLYYSIVDMTLAFGTGSVVSSINLLDTKPVSHYGYSATSHCNGTDIWLVANNYSVATNNLMYSYLITTSGISSSPIVTSTIGAVPSVNQQFGHLKFAPNGKRLGKGSVAGFEVFDFDNTSGLVSNVVSLGFGVTPLGQPDCIEFSPDGSKFYASKNGSTEMLQWDLCAGTATQVVNSRYSYSITGVVPPGWTGDLALAIDGKIYCMANLAYLSVIANPNATGLSSLYTPSALPLPQVNNQRYWLPYNYNSYYKTNPIPTNFTYSSVPTSCQTYSFNSAFTVGSYVTGCTASSYSVNFMAWDFGDPSSGSANTSTLQSPTHFYSVPGTYTVTLYAYYQCGIAPSILQQTVVIPGPTFAITSTSITCANLGSGTITPTFSATAFTHSWLPTALTGSAVNGLAPGTYTVLSTNSNLGVCIYSTSVTFNPLVALNASIAANPSITCNAAFTGTGQVTNITGGSATQNFLWTNGTQTTSIASPTNLSAGNWTISVTDALTACQVTSVLAITQPPALSPTLSISSPSICAGSSAILSATNSGGTPAYTYTFINGPISYSSIVTESLVGTHVYTVQSTDANNCLSSATVALNVITNPNLFVPTVSICPTAIAQFTASGASTYTWLPQAATSSVTALAPSTITVVNFTDTPLSNTQYTIIGSALGCTSTTTTSVFIYASPVPIISSNSPRCEGSNAILSVSGGTGAVWSGPNIFSSSALGNTITALGLANAGVYSTTITSAVGCTASANSTFVVNPTPTVTVAGSTVCTSQTMALFANAIAGSSYQWFGANNYSSFVQNPTLPNPTLSRTGSYTVLVTAPTSCTRTAVAQVSVTNPPLPLLTFATTSMCAQAFNGSPNTITLSPSGANSYTLYTPNLLGSSTPVVPSTSLFATAPFSSSLATGIATLQGSNGVCTSTTGYVFTVVPNPTVGINSYTPVICAGQNFTYTSNGASSYVWSSSTPNYTTWNNGGVAVAHPSINAVFSVYGSSLGCNSALQTSSITVYPLPTITLSAKSSSICLFDKTDISVNGMGTSFQWLPMIGLNAYTGTLVTCGTHVNQVYTVIATANNCTAAATSSVHVWPLPTPSIANVKSSVCLNENIVLSGNGGVNFDWKGPDKLSASGQTIRLAAVSPAMAGTYTLVVADENACKSSTTTQVNILPLPDGSLVNIKEEFCVPYCAAFNFVGSNSSNIQSTWLLNGTSFANNNFKYCFKEAGTFTLSGKLVDNTTSCKSSLQYVITTHPKPVADFNFLPKEPIENLDEVQFTNLSEGQGFLSYHWFFNDNKGFSTTSKNTSYLYSEPGDYRVALITKTNWGCADTVLKTIVVAPDFALYVPNTFTPNDDSRNDVFFASVRSSKLFDLKIYDRWGAEIFHATSPNDAWDGTFKGEACKQDAYTWVIELSTVGGERVVKTGTVLLLR